MTGPECRVCWGDWPRHAHWCPEDYGSQATVDLYGSVGGEGPASRLGPRAAPEPPAMLDRIAECRWCDRMATGPYGLCEPCIGTEHRNGRLPLQLGRVEVTQSMIRRWERNRHRSEGRTREPVPAQ